MSLKKLALVLIAATLILHLQTTQVFAGTINEQESVGVSATVPDETPPSTPILIAPENGAYLDSGQITFIFKKSNDQQSFVRHYEMHLKDELKVPEIPATQTPVENNQFLCVITSDRIKLTLKQALSDGVYTWKIRAVDNYGNQTDSALWTFTVDTIGPFIVLNQVGNENTKLGFSSKDPDSVPPSTSLTTYNLKPTFAGKSEPNASLRITLTSSSGNRYQLSGRIDNQGNFQLIPDRKLSTGTYTVQLVASDPAGNTNLLPEFQLTIKKPQFLTTIPRIISPEIFYEIPLPTFARFCIAEQAVTLLVLLVPLLLWYLLCKISYGIPFQCSLVFITNYSFLFKNLKKLFNDQKQTINSRFNNQALGFTQLTIFKKINDNLLQKQQAMTNKKGTYNPAEDFQFDLILLSRPGFEITKVTQLPEPNNDIGLVKTNQLAFYKTLLFIARIFLWLSLFSSLLILFSNPAVLYLILFLVSLDLIIGLLI
jgi:hypothetical protein